MRDRCIQSLPLLFSLGLHGVIASLFWLTHAEILGEEPVTFAVEWREPNQSYSPIGGHSRAKTLDMVSYEPAAPKASVALSRAPQPSARNAPKKEFLKSRIKSGMTASAVVTTSGSTVSTPASSSKHHTFFSRAPVRSTCHPEHASEAKNKNLRKSYQPLPKYPWVCRKRGQTGRVYLRVKTNEEGHVTEAQLHKSSGHSPLDIAALTAVKEWVFSASPSQKVISIFFQLNG